MLFFLGSYHADAGSGATTGATTVVSVILTIIACCALCCSAGCYSYCKQLETDVATTTPSVINATRPVATSATMPKIVIQDPTKPGKVFLEMQCSIIQKNDFATLKWKN